MDRGEYHSRKKELRNRAWFGNLLLVVGVLTCWTIIGLWVGWKGLKMTDAAKEERRELEREFEQYENETAGAGAVA